MGDGIDVVVLQAEAPAAVNAASAGELGHRAEVEGGAQLDRQVATEVLHGVDGHPVMEDGLHEGVPRELLGQGDGDRSPVDDVADLAGMRVASPPCEEVADDHELGRSTAYTVPAGSVLGELHQGIGGAGLEGLRRSTVGTRLPSSALGGELDAMDERDAGLGWKRASEADHAQSILPVSEVPGLLLAGMDVIDPEVGVAVVPCTVA